MIIITGLRIASHRPIKKERQKSSQGCKQGNPPCERKRRGRRRKRTVRRPTFHEGPILGGGRRARDVTILEQSAQQKPCRKGDETGRACDTRMEVGHETHWALVEAEHWMRFESCRGQPIRPIEYSLGTATPPRPPHASRAGFLWCPCLVDPAYWQEDVKLPV